MDVLTPKEYYETYVVVSAISLIDAVQPNNIHGSVRKSSGDTGRKGNQDGELDDVRGVAYCEDSK